MISKKELIREIEEYESKQPTYQVCEKLANLYIIYDHLYGNKNSYNPFDADYSFSSAPQNISEEKNADIKIVLPAYNSYVDAKKDYQYGNISIDKVLKTFKTLSDEIKDFLKMLYRNTDTPEERKILSNLINDINVGNL